MTDQGPLTAVATGAAGTIGRAVAESLHRRGARMTAVVRAETAPAARAMTCIDEVVVGNLADPGEVGQVTSRLATTPLDVLVCAAGIFGPLGPLAKQDADACNEVLLVNLIAPVRLSGAVIPGMVARGWAASSLSTRRPDGHHRRPHTTGRTRSTARPSTAGRPNWPWNWIPRSPHIHCTPAISPPVWLSTSPAAPRATRASPPKRPGQRPPSPVATTLLPRDHSSSVSSDTYASAYTGCLLWPASADRNPIDLPTGETVHAS